MCRVNYAIIIFSLFLFSNCNGQNNTKEISGPYLGQEPPGLTPVIFAPGIVSTGDREFNSIFSPSGNEFYFSKRIDGKYNILWMKQTADGWSEPEVAPFSGEFNDFDAGISQDGNRLFFCSNRPVPASKNSKTGYDIWYVTRTDAGWSSPIHVDGIVNEGEHQIYPTLAKNNTLYFTSRRDGTIGKRDVFKSNSEDGIYLKIENLGNNVNTEFDEGDAFIAPDESYIIVCAMERPDCLGSGDLYISFKDKDGKWTKYKHMGNIVNSSSSDYCPNVSPDGKYLFFTSGRNGSEDIYWVDAKIIESFKQQN